MKYLFILFFCVNALAVPVQFVTESLPPYQVVDDREQLIGGTSYSVLKELIERSGLDAQIDVMPWARAYKTTIETPNTFVFSIARSDSRENMFKWVIPLRHLTYHFYGLKRPQKKPFENIGDMQALKVAAVRGSIEADFLKRHGFREGENLILTNQYASTWEMVAIGRADAVYGEENVVDCLSRSIGFDASPFHILFSLGHDLSLYVAANKDTSPEIIEKVQKTYQAMMNEGRVAKIVTEQEQWIFSRPSPIAP